MYASKYHSYTHLILALGIVRKPTVRVLLLHNILASACLVGVGLSSRSRAPLPPYACPQATLWATPTVLSPPVMDSGVHALDLAM